MRFPTLWLALAAIMVLCLGAGPTMAQPEPSSPAPAQPAATVPAPEAAVGASSAYVLGRDDVVEVGLLGRTDFGGRLRVQADGTIQLPFIGRLQATGRTTSEVSDIIRNALKSGGYFADPVVTIEIVGYSSRYVTVLGAVGTPSLVPINKPYRLSEILARVGGVRDGAADYLIIRSERGEERRVLVREIATGGLDSDPYVQAGDKIFSPVAEVFYIYGKVNSPGAYSLMTGLTVRQALAKGGGLGESGSDKKVSITRKGQKQKAALSDSVQPDDVIEVGERLF